MWITVDTGWPIGKERGSGITSMPGFQGLNVIGTALAWWRVGGGIRKEPRGPQTTEATGIHEVETGRTPHDTIRVGSGDRGVVKGNASLNHLKSKGIFSAYIHGA